MYLLRRKVIARATSGIGLQGLSRAVSTLLLPSLSPTMEKGVIAEWKKAPGDVVQAGDILCDIDTDKASVGFEVSLCSAD